MGNSVTVIILDRAGFDKRSSTRGILQTVYIGRVMHSLFNMVDIAIIEDGGNDEGEFYDEDIRRGSDEEELSESEAMIKKQ